MPMTRALIIRSQEDALPLAKDLKAKGIASSVHPLYEPQLYPLPPLDNPQALIITSKNALRAMMPYPELKGIPLYVVGDQTAEFARVQGYPSIYNASGTGNELLELILAKASPDQGILWHLSGDVVKRDFIAPLRAQGFQAKRQVVYEMRSPQALPKELSKELLGKKISHILFFSPHTTKIFVTLLKKCGLGDNTNYLEALCLSKDIAVELEGLSWKKVWISSHPTQQSLTGYFHEEEQKITRDHS